MSAVTASGVKRLRWGFLFVGVFGLIAYGMWTGFPVWDDSYLVLFLRESTLDNLTAHHSHRPVFGWLLRMSAAAFGLHPGPYIVMAIGLWALLAWQTARLARRLRPGDGVLPPLGALLVLAPILVATQFTTATTVLSVNLPVSMAVAALLVCLAAEEPIGRGRGLGVAALLIGAVTISEYGLAAGCAAVAFLAVRRRFRDAGWVAAGIAAGYALFRAVGRVEMRAKQLPSVQVGKLLREPHLAVLRFLEGLWHSLVGAWASAAGSIRLEADSRSTLFAAVAGVAVAWLFFASDRRESVLDPAAPRSWPALAAAVAAGILPVVGANRAIVSADPYNSRYLLPVLPFAALFVALGLRLLTRVQARRTAVAIAAGVAVYSLIIGTFQTRALQERMEAIGARLRPLVRDPGIAVAVVPDLFGLDDADMTPKITWKWSDAEAAHAWVIPEEVALEFFGPRAACRDTTRIETPFELMTTGRKGPVSHLVWLSPWGTRPFELEPYCVGPVR